MKEILKLIYDVCDKEDREKISEFVKNKDKEWLIEYFIENDQYSLEFIFYIWVLYWKL